VAPFWSGQQGDVSELHGLLLFAESEAGAPAGTRVDGVLTAG
jgi:hypothetical protein